MAIESAAFISDLNTSNPPGSDPIGQADDHIRLLKAVLKSTFPNITGAVSSTQSQLNTSLVPTGCILLWSGSTASIPSGWALCNGQTAVRTDGSGNITTPDLRNRFVVGVGTTYAVGDTGGATTSTTNVTITNQAVTLTTSQIPSHTHTAQVSEDPHTHAVNQTPHSHGYSRSNTGTVVNGTNAALAVNAEQGRVSTNSDTASAIISLGSTSTNVSVVNGSTGGGGSHTHNNTLSQSSISILPPYYALAYIMKL